MVSKLYALKGEKFDISKVTVVGNPTITNDGVASGFSGSSYITYGTINFNAANTWELQDCFTTGNDFSALQFYGGFGKDGNFGLGTNINTDGYIVINIASGNSTWDIASNIPSTLKVNPNTTYFMKRYFTGTQYKIDLSTDNTNWINYITINSSVKVNPNATTICLGQFAGLNRPFTGSINLKQFKIYVDGQLVFQPTKPTYLLERRKEGYDPSKFTVVGTPTITDDGEASGFSSNQGLNIQTFDFSTISEFKVDFKFTTPSEIDNDDDIIVGMAGHNTTGFMLRWRNGDRKLSALPYLSRTLVSASTNINSVVLELNKTYYGQFVFDVKNNKTILGVSKDGINYVSTSLIIANEMPTYWENISIGYSGSTTLYFKGSIDLSQFSITVDGKEVFTGAKEQFYAFEGGK